MSSTKTPLGPADKARIEAAYKAAQRLQAANLPDQARAAYAALLRHYPMVAEAQFQIARIELSARRFVEARSRAEAALKLRPLEEALWLLLADIAHAEGRPPASALLARARKAGLSEAALKRIRGRFALATAASAMPEVPAPAKPLVERAMKEVEAGNEAVALRHLNRALTKAPGSAPILVFRGETQLTLGDVAAAQADARAAIDAAPEVGLAWSVWARTAGKIKADDPMLAELERRHAAAPEGGEDRRQMAYALAKAMEDIRADERFFVFLNEANGITARMFPYGFEADAAIAEASRAAYTTALVKRWGGRGATGLTPIFVTGLPRSGTTLIEQILASHPEVAAGGEMALLNKPLGEAVARIAKEGDARGADLIEVGRRYLGEASRRAKGKAYLTDKSISTYAHIGHARLALPGAKIILVRRDSRDSCLSILKQRFKDGTHRYSNSMQWTAQFYRLFAAQVAFWREAAPEAFIEVRYEDVVADLESQARRLIDYVGLTWDEACLDFHKTERSVKTLSSAQVRQPLYSSSVGAWKRYEKDLEPLLKALGPVEDLP